MFILTAIYKPHNYETMERHGETMERHDKTMEFNGSHTRVENMSLLLLFVKYHVHVGGYLENMECGILELEYWNEYWNRILE